MFPVTPELKRQLSVTRAWELTKKAVCREEKQDTNAKTGSGRKTDRKVDF